MNYSGSYRRLFGNAISAMIGAIEIYNKPRFSYRDEVFVILLINAWELALKAVVSKSRQRIYYPKRRGEPYRTITLRDAFWRAANSKLWPKGMELRAVEANLDLLTAYRDSAVHFYNDSSFSSVIYSLAQTSILNFRDLVAKVFEKDLAEEISWRIMPLGAKNPVDPIKFMKGSDGSAKRSRSAQEFLAALKSRADALSADGIDTGRLITVFDVNLQSIKKINQADIVVGVTKEELADSVVISQRVDPNISHPYRQKDVLPKLRKRTTAHEFQAIVYAHKLRNNHRYCWTDAAVSLVRWSPQVVTFINDLSDEERRAALAKYSARSKGKPKK